MTSAHARRQRGRQTVQLQSPLSPADCVRRLEAWDQRPQSAFAFLAGRMQDNGTIAFRLRGRPGWWDWTSPLWAPYFHGTLKSNPATARGTIIVGWFGFDRGLLALPIILVICALVGTSVLLLLGGRRQGIALLVFTCFGLAFFCADLCFTRWVRRDEPRQMTAFLSTTLQAAPDSTVGQASDTQRTEQDR